MEKGRTWAEINLSAAAKNIEIIKKIVGHNCEIMSVVKADGYGHGAVKIAKTIDFSTNYFAVSNIDEAKALREGGICKPILILGYSPLTEENVKFLADFDVTQTIFSYEFAEKLNSLATNIDKIIKVHIKIETGMNRLGFDAQNDGHFQTSFLHILNISRFKNLEAEGIFTHFSVADEENNPFTKTQFERFMRMKTELERHGIFFKYHHTCNSAAIINFPEMHLNMVRPGLILYGIPINSHCVNIFSPVMELKTVISHIHTIKKGETVSYGQIFTANRDTKIATLPIGYADGLFRTLSNHYKVSLNGCFATIVGRICMDQCMIDITDCDVSVGNEVTIFGGQTSVYQISEAAKTIPHEIVCGVSKRVPRVYFTKS